MNEIKNLGASSLETFEALEWLRNNNNPSALASNRFEETDNAIKFVETLYGHGADKVSVVGIMDEPERVEEEGGPYASSLIVELPKDTEKRDKIIEFYKKEVAEQEIEEGEGILEWNDSRLSKGLLWMGIIP